MLVEAAAQFVGKTQKKGSSMESVAMKLEERNLRHKQLFDSLGLSADSQNSDPYEVKGDSKANLLVTYERGNGEASAQLQLQLRFSHDGDVWYKETLLGASDFTERSRCTNLAPPFTSANLSLAFDMPPAKFVKASVLETGVSTNYGSVTMDLLLVP